MKKNDSPQLLKTMSEKTVFKNLLNMGNGVQKTIYWPNLGCAFGVQYAAAAAASTVKAHSHQARLRSSTRVDVRRATCVDGRRRASTPIWKC